MSGRARLAAWAVGVFLALCITNVDAAGYLVSNCSEECSVIVETTGDIDATCEPVEGLEVFECECYRPFMTNWEEVNGTIVAIGDHPKCRHAFSYGSGGLLALQYLPNILCIICIVYAGLIISNKAEAIMSRSNSELKSPRRCVCVYNQLIGAAILIIAAQLLRVVYLSVDPQGYFEIMPAAVNVVCLRVGFQLIFISIFMVMDSWFLVLELLPMPSDDQGEEEDASRSCNTRRTILWLCGVVTVTLEVVGLAFQFAAPDATVLGFTISTMVNVLTIILSFLVMLAWASSGFTFISRMQKVVDVAPRVRSLITLFNTHLIVLCVMYVVYAVLVILYPLFLSSDPYLYTVTLTLHRTCEFFIAYSLLRIIDGNGDRYVSPLCCGAVARPRQLSASHPRAQGKRPTRGPNKGEGATDVEMVKVQTSQTNTSVTQTQ